MWLGIEILQLCSESMPKAQSTIDAPCLIHCHAHSSQAPDILGRWEADVAQLRGSDSQLGSHGVNRIKQYSLMTTYRYHLNASVFQGRHDSLLVWL